MYHLKQRSKMGGSIVSNRKALEASLDRPNVNKGIEDGIGEFASRLDALRQTKKAQDNPIDV